MDDSRVPSLCAPNLDRLRSEGITLQHGYSSCPICMPTRMTWAYGLYASQVAEGLLHNAHDWPRGLPTMPQRLQDAGYYTALIGKLHSLAWIIPRDVISEEAVTCARGFDEAFEVSGKILPAGQYRCRYSEHLASKGLLERYVADVRARSPFFGNEERLEPSFLAPEDHMDGFIGDRVCEWIGSYERDQPFFLHASLCGPHFPLDPPSPFFEHYQPEEMPPPVGDLDADDAGRWLRDRALYCGLIEFVDHQVGRMLAALERRGLADDTLVLFTTDHGDMMGDHGLRYKGHPYDASVRTPVIARLPGRIAAGARSDALVESVDLPLTILDAVGVDVASPQTLPQTPGRSYWPVLTGDRNEHRDWVYSEAGARGRKWRMCRERNWKYVFSAGGDDKLFDMAADPDELVNAVDAPVHAGRLSRMRRQLVESMSCCVAPNTDHAWDHPDSGWPL
jgi:choline-sulfatase